MKRKILRYVRVVSVFLTFGFLASGSLVLVGSENTYAKSCPDGDAYILTFPAWYNGLVEESDCSLKTPDTSADENALTVFIFQIGLNVAEIVLQLAAYGTIVMIMKSGFDYMTANGEEQKLTGAKTTLRNAIVGLVIALASVAIVKFVGDMI